MIDFQDIGYLKNGNERQKSAYQTLIKYHVFEKLSAFNPLLAGTIPIEIDIPVSDLDIICHWQNVTDFILLLEKSFAAEQDFSLRKEMINGQQTVIANFWIDDFEVEVFGQNIPSTKQNAFKHMLIEHQILQEKGDGFKQQIIELKRQGLKTEPAFAQLLELAGNPYEALLNYYV